MELLCVCVCVCVCVCAFIFAQFDSELKALNVDELERFLLAFENADWFVRCVPITCIRRVWAKYSTVSEH